MVLVATAVMVVMDPVDPRLDCCTRRSSRHIRIRTGTGFGGWVGGGGGDARRSRRWLLVLCGDGSDSKTILPPKTVSWEHLFRPVATQHDSW